MTRVYLDMVADLFHVGHLNCLKQARNLFDSTFLIVGIHSDKDVESYKRTPVINEKHRYEMIKNCKLVDKVIEAAPLIITEEFIKEHKIDFVVHGNDVSKELEKQHAVPIKMGKVKYVNYTDDISTSEIIRKIQNGASLL